MKRVLNLIFIFLPLLGFAQNGEFDVRLSYDSYGCSPEKIAVLVEMKSTSASTAFDMGDATLRFDYKLTEVTNPVLKKQHNFSSAATTKDFNYQPQSLNKAEAGNDGIVTLNVSYVGLNDGAKTVNENWIPVATVEFDLVAANKCIALKWHDNDRTPITGMSEVITPGAQPVSQAITGSQFLDLSHCVTDILPEATIVASPSSITEGDESKLTITLANGQGNWSAVLSDGSTVNNSTNPSEEITVSPTGTAVYTITSVTSTCGTTSYTSDAPSAKIKVLPKNVGSCDNQPLPMVTVTASPSSILLGASSTLTVALTEGTGNWSATLSNGSTVSNSSNSSETFTVSPTENTTYSVTLLSDACGTNPFPTDAPSATVTITNVDPCKDKSLPTAAISASPSSIIEGENSNLTVTLTNGTGDWSATLSNGSEVVNSSNIDEIFTVSPTTSTTYKITSVTDACGTNPYALNAPEITIGVLPKTNDPCLNKPLPSVSISALPNSIKQGESTTLTVTLVNGQGDWSATLSDGSEITNSSNTNETFTLFPTATTTYTVTSVTDACGTNSYATNAPSAIVEVLPNNANPCLNKPLPSATLTASPSSIIEGESSVLEVALTTGSGIWSAKFADGREVNNSTNSNETITVSPTATTTYTIASVTDECGVTNYSANAPSATITVSADPCLNKPLPTATILASSNSIVEGESSTLTVTLTGGTGEWSADLSDGSTVKNSSNSSETFTVSPLGTTTYSITSVTDACGTNPYATNAPSTTIAVSLIANPCANKPLPTATLTASSNSIKQGESVALTITPVGGTGNWSAGLSDGSEVVNSPNLSETLTVTPTASTTYSLLSLSDACGTNKFALNAAPSVTIGVEAKATCIPQPCLPITVRIIRK